MKKSTNNDHPSFDLIDVDLVDHQNGNSNHLDQVAEGDEDDVLLLQGDEKHKENGSIDFLTGKGKIGVEGEDDSDSFIKKRKKIGIYSRRNSLKKGKFEEMKFGDHENEFDNDDPQSKNRNRRNLTKLCCCNIL